MSDLAEMKAYVADAAREHGHDLGGWRGVGTREQPRSGSSSALMAGRPLCAVALLAARPERPRRRAAEPRDELAALHSITSSASC